VALVAGRAIVATSVISLRSKMALRWLRRRAGACGVQMRALREAQRRVHHGMRSALVRDGDVACSGGTKTRATRAILWHPS